MPYASRGVLYAPSVSVSGRAVAGAAGLSPRPHAASSTLKKDRAMERAAPRRVGFGLEWRIQRGHQARPAPSPIAAILPQKTARTAPIQESTMT